MFAFQSAKDWAGMKGTSGSAITKTHTFMWVPRSFQALSK